MADTWNFEIEQGATFQMRFTVMADNGTPIYSASWTPKFQIRATQDPAAGLIADAATGPNSISYNATTGEIDVVLAASVTAAMTFSTAYYDVQMVNGTAKDRLSQGSVSFNKGVVP